jgi:outer membrane protein assembly factor BamB
LTPGTSTPRRAFYVAAVGCSAGRAVDVYFDTTNTALAVTFTVPVNAQPGDHWIRLVERVTGRATQRAFKVSNNWASWGFDAQGTSANIYENTPDKTNVNQLTPVWTALASDVGNATPLLVADETVISHDVRGSIKAFAMTDGKLLWTAELGVNNFPAATPVAMGTRVFFPSDDGRVRATGWTMDTSAGGFTPAPVYALSVVYAGGCTTVGAYNAYTGAVLWSAASGQVRGMTYANGVL